MTLTVTSNRFEADSIVSMLQVEGIRTMTRAADEGSYLYGGIHQRTTILVMPSDLEAARALLDSPES